MAADFSAVRLEADTSEAALLEAEVLLAGAAPLGEAGHPAEAALPGNFDNACYKSNIINAGGAHNCLKRIIKTRRGSMPCFYIMGRAPVELAKRAHDRIQNVTVHP